MNMFRFVSWLSSPLILLALACTSLQLQGKQDPAPSQIIFESLVPKDGIHIWSVGKNQIKGTFPEGNVELKYKAGNAYGPGPDRWIQFRCTRKSILYGETAWGDAVLKLQPTRADIFIEGVQYSLCLNGRILTGRLPSGFETNLRFGDGYHTLTEQQVVILAILALLNKE